VNSRSIRWPPAPRCAGKDRFFPTVELLFRTQRTWAVENPIAPLLATVQPLGFTRASFEACLADPKILDGIDWVRHRAVDKFRVNSTPTFFINGRKHTGFMSIDEMEPLLRP
jgi:protein-disulfide isomerase